MNRLTKNIGWCLAVVMVVILLMCGIRYLSSTRKHTPVHHSSQVSPIKIDARDGIRNSQLLHKEADLPTSVISQKAEMINPERAKKLLLEYGKISSMQERSILVSKLMKDLCNAGYSEEAWQMIDEKYGTVRTSQIYVFFSTAKLSQSQIFDKISELRETGYDNEQMMALSSYMGKYGTDEIGSLLANAQFKALADSAVSKDQFKNMMESFFIMKLDDQTGDNQKRIIENAEQLYSKDFLSSDDILSILRRANSLNPFEKWDSISKTIPNAPDDPERNREKIIQQMITENAPNAMDLLISSKGTQTSSDLLSALKKWTIEEPDAANKWYGKNQKILSDDQQDAAVRAFSELAMGYGEKENALQWANQIKNSDLKAKILNEISPTALKTPYIPRPNNQR